VQQGTLGHAPNDLPEGGVGDTVPGTREHLAGELLKFFLLWGSGNTPVVVDFILADCFDNSVCFPGCWGEVLAEEVVCGC